MPHPYARDTHGTPIPGDPSPARGPYAGAVREREDGGLWSIRLDPLLDPVVAGATVTDGTRSWRVLDARLIEVPGYSAVDYIAVTGELDPPEVP